MDQVPNNWDKRQVARQASYLQSSWWGQFQAGIGAKPHYLSQDGWSCLLIEKSNRIGRYLFSPYGPTADSIQALDDCLAYLADYGKKIGASWLSLEPVGPPPQEIKKILAANHAKPAARHREPDLTRIVDLSPAPDEILATVSQSTRSFIRKNQREKFVGFKTSTDPKDIALFTTMLNAVADKKNIFFYSDSYFKSQAQLLMPKGVMYLELALQDHKPVAAALFYDYGQNCTYTFAGSLPQARQTNAPTLLLWQAMLNAKARGNKKMDLYGIAPDNASSSHPWAGFTAFKAKFGGQVVAYAGTWDIPLNNRYHLYKAAIKARKYAKRH